ncbi:MAG: hypothetical protein M3Z08_08220 [Chloroflexota bacterium]|nr:hypothetical protein [Chloroflexota bacterium]
MLQKGDRIERLFAIFASGYALLPTGAEQLIPFLTSSFRKERWASAIALGRAKHESVFTMLQDLLLEDMEYHPPHDNDALCEIIYAAAKEAEGRFGNRDWEKVVDTAMVEAWNESQAYLNDYHWFIIHRFTIMRLLGAWGNPRAISALCQTFAICWDIEQHPDARGKLPGRFTQTWQHLQDELAYALGQLQTWHALDDLALPPVRLRLARMYLLFGSLQANTTCVFSQATLGLIFDPDTSGFFGTLRHMWGFAPPLIDPAIAANILGKQYGLSEEEQAFSIQHFEKDYWERHEPHSGSDDVTFEGDDFLE